jgi:hypothetical protein
MHYIPSALNGLSGPMTARAQHDTAFADVYIPGHCKQLGKPEDTKFREDMRFALLLLGEASFSKRRRKPAQVAIVFPDVECCNAIHVMLPIQRS